MLNTIKKFLRRTTFYNIYKSLESEIAKIAFWNPSSKITIIGGKKSSFSEIIIYYFM